MARDKLGSTGKSLSEALIVAEHGENLLCTYITCSECQNQFLYTACSPDVLSLEFSRTYWTCNSLKNMSRASDKDLPILFVFLFSNDLNWETNAFFDQ